jgi:Zn ribbon nucleic-acid-binding protein
MSDFECPKCKTEYEASGSHEDDSGDRKCAKCGFRFIVTIEYEPSYYTSCVKHEFGEVQQHGLFQARFCVHCSDLDTDSIVRTDQI